MACLAALGKAAPLAPLLLCWQMQCCTPMHGSAQSHRFWAPKYSLAQRKAAREATDALGAMAQLLMRHERAQRPGKDSDPDDED